MLAFTSLTLGGETSEVAKKVTTGETKSYTRTAWPGRNRNSPPHASNLNSNYRPPATYPRVSERISRNCPVARELGRLAQRHPPSAPTGITNGGITTTATSLGKQTSTDSTLPEPSPSDTQQGFPFSCSAHIYAPDDTSQVISTSLWLKIETKSREPSGSHRSRSLCKVTAERIHVQLTKDETEPPILGLEDIRLKMGPCMDGFNGTAREMRLYRQSFRALWKYPELHHILIKEGTSGSEVGGKFAVQFFPPAGSAELNGKKTRGISQAGKSLGFNQSNISVECLNDQRYLWRYPISSGEKGLPQPLFARSATFEDHWGDFSCWSDQPPPSFRIEIPIICRLSTLGSTQYAPRFIRYKAKNFPCRDVRMNLQVDVLPNELGCFDFPRSGYSGGKDLHLGIYRFTNENDHLCLDIDRYTTQLTLNDPNLIKDNGGTIHEDGNWEITAGEPGDLKLREICSDRVVCPTQGTLQLDLTNSRK